MPPENISEILQSIDNKLKTKFDDLHTQINTLSTSQSKLATQLAVFMGKHKAQEHEFADQQNKVRENCKAVSTLREKTHELRLKLEMKEDACREERNRNQKLCDDVAVFRAEMHLAEKKYSGELHNLRASVSEEISDLKDDVISPLETAMTKLSTRVATYAAGAGFIGLLLFEVGKFFLTKNGGTP